MKAVDREENWVPAWDALQSVARKFGGLRRAQHALAIALREQLLTTAAEQTAVSEGDEEFVEEAATDFEIIEIPCDVWSRSDHWESDRLRWDWVEGDFEIENVDYECMYLFFGVHFLQHELDELETSHVAFDELRNMDERQNRLDQAKGARRGPKPSMRWAAYIEAVLKLERDGDLVTGKYDGPKELLTALHAHMAVDQFFDARTIEPVVRMMRLVQAGTQSQRERKLMNFWPSCAIETASFP